MVYKGIAKMLYSMVEATPESIKTNQSEIMDECVSNHQVLLPENYIVQPVENIPLSMIDYEKIEMAHLIHAGQLTNSVIQIADVNSNLKTKELHPLEAEIQRDLELKQQATGVASATAKRSAASVIQSPTQLAQELANKQKCLDPAGSMYDGVMPLQLVDERESVLNVNPSKTQDSALCHIPQFNRPVVLEKRQYIIVSDNSVLLNIGNEGQMKDPAEGNEGLTKKSLCVNVCNAKNHSDEKPKQHNVTVESDSENETDDVEPVFDYEPDPDNSSTVNIDHKEKPNKCYMCFKSFRQKKNMYAHIRKIHSTQPKIEGGILCPLCKMHALRQEHLRNHLETLHEIKIEKEEKLFTTMEEFFSWKEYIERETLSFYVSKSSSKLLANNQQKTYYKCHRSGNYVTLKKENRKKKLKVQGSNKIGATCPAAIEVTENIHGINVTFWKTHVGHENDLAHLVLSREDKARIMDYVASGIPWDKILEIFKKEASKGASAPSKLAMVSKQDLRNIKKIHEMKMSSEMYSPRKKIIQGRKPIKEKMLRRASQALVIEKADILLNLLETTDVKAEFRPKICLMIDNLISTVRRRATKNTKKESCPHRRRQWSKQHGCEVKDDKEQRDSSDSELNNISAEDPSFEGVMEYGGSEEKNFSEQTSCIRLSRRNSRRENAQKKIISSFCH